MPFCLIHQLLLFTFLLVLVFLWRNRQMKIDELEAKLNRRCGYRAPTHPVLQFVFVLLIIVVVCLVALAIFELLLGRPVVSWLSLNVCSYPGQYSPFAAPTYQGGMTPPLPSAPPEWEGPQWEGPQLGKASPFSTK